MVNELSTQEQAEPGIKYFPSGTLDQLSALTGLDAEQITNILGMINGPEQGKSEWWLTADDKIIYGYAENIKDKRGVTIGIYGATTADGDADLLWKNYGHEEYGDLNDEEIIDKVHQIAKDHKWWKAQWDAYISKYWKPTLKLIESKGYTQALTIGTLMDTAMNAGLDDDNSDSWGVKHLVKKASADTNNEQDFLDMFLKLRQEYPTERSGDMEKRIGAWQKLKNCSNSHVVATSLQVTANGIFNQLSTIHCLFNILFDKDSIGQVGRISSLYYFALHP